MNLKVGCWIDRNLARALCAAYIALWVGMAVDYVGEMQTCVEPVSSWLPVSIFSLLFIPAALGYLAGKGNRS